MEYIHAKHTSNQLLHQFVPVFTHQQASVSDLLIHDIGQGWRLQPWLFSSYFYLLRTNISEKK